MTLLTIIDPFFELFVIIPLFFIFILTETLKYLSTVICQTQ